MVASVSFRPQVTMSAPVVQQAKAENCKEELNRLDSDVKKNRVSDISAMTQRMMLESQLNDTKVEPVKYVEELKPTENSPATSNAADITPKNVTDVIAKFHKGKQPSKVEQSQVLMNQMDMFATSNRLLHGLF